MGSSVDPKKLNQPRILPSGKLTQNGFFAQAVDEYKLGRRLPERVRVYEKLFPGVWTDKGLFELIDYRTKHVGYRNVYRFFLRSLDEEVSKRKDNEGELPVSRLIPSEVKKEVWKRDKGRCTFPGCGKTDNLHFDHEIPFSRGGSSLTAANIRLLCARHNIQKHDKIE
jgi:hypothetical protein